MAKQERNYLEQGLPAALDSENSVLGSILLSNETYRQAESLEVVHFSLDSNRRIFAAMMDMFEDGVSVDMITLADTLRSRNQLEAVGGVPYIASLTDGVIHRGNIEHYVRILDDKKQRRSMILAANKAIQQALDPTAPADKILEALQAETYAIADAKVDSDVDIFLPVSKFIKSGRNDIDWRLKNVIEVGTSGLIIGPPKSRKSLAGLYLTCCMATGAPWFDLDIKQCRTAIVSREDFPGTTRRRIDRLMRGMGINSTGTVYDEWLYVNTRDQSEHLMLDNPRELRILIKNLLKRRVEFCLLDVLNVLHEKEENDNSQMSMVMKFVKRIKNETGCQIGIVHHARKAQDELATISEIVRGAGAIGGFAEWIIDNRPMDEEKGIVRSRFETKASRPQSLFYWKPNDSEITNSVSLERTEWEPPKKESRARRTAAAVTGA